MDTNEEHQPETPSNIPQIPEEKEVKENRPVGPVVGIVIVVVLLIVGGLYFWGNQIFVRSDKASSVEDITGADPVAENLKTQSTSDEVGSIEKDLQTTDLNNIDSDLKNIDSELLQ